MVILDTALDPRAPSYLDNRSTALAALSVLESVRSRATQGGGEREVTRHHARGKLLPRERMELLVDRDTALLELSVGVGPVVALGIVEQVECVLVGNDPTVEPNDSNERIARAVELAKRFGLPLIGLWESTSDACVTNSAPSIFVIFGSADGTQCVADHVIALRGRPGCEHADQIAEDERDALRFVRQAVRPYRRQGSVAYEAAWAPRHDGYDLIAVASADPAAPTQLGEVLARVLDDSELDELRPHRGMGLLTGFGSLHGYRVGVLGNTRSTVDTEAVEKGLELIRLADGLPILLLANPSTTGSPVLQRALAGYRGATVTVVLGESPPEWALAGNGFVFRWPSVAEPRKTFDGVIDPRDTRTVLGICLSVATGGQNQAARA